MNNELTPDREITVIGSIRRKAASMAECINNAILLNMLVQGIAQRHPDADINRLPLPVFKTNFARIVQLSTEAFQMCHILAAFCAIQERRYLGKTEELSWYTQKIIDETRDSEKSMRWLAMSALDFLTEFMAEFHAKRREIERLAAEIRDCAEERDAMVDKSQSIGEAAEGILKYMATLKTYHDFCDSQVAALRKQP
jgi:hypothetical protein